MSVWVHSPTYNQAANEAFYGTRRELEDVLHLLFSHLRSPCPLLLRPCLLSLQCIGFIDEFLALIASKVAVIPPTLDETRARGPENGVCVCGSNAAVTGSVGWGGGSASAVLGARRKRSRMGAAGGTSDTPETAVQGPARHWGFNIRQALRIGSGMEEYNH